MDYDETIGKIDIILQDVGGVILNLTTNAFYAINKRKQLPLDDYKPAASVTTRKTNSKVELLILDYGKGIPQKVVDKILQPLFTTKTTGEGTGLSLIYFIPEGVWWKSENENQRRWRFNMYY